MKQKLIEYIENTDFKENCVYVYVDNVKKPIIKFALLKNETDNKLIVYYNELYSTETNSLSSREKWQIINDDNFIIIPKDEWSSFKKQSIRNTMLLYHNDEQLNSLKLFVKNNAGKIVNHNNIPHMFVGISSSDEDYYYVLVSMPEKENDDCKLVFSSCCCHLVFNNVEYPNIQENNLLKYIRENKLNIINTINNLESDVMINGIHFNSYKHCKKHKPNALEQTIKSYRAYVIRKKGKENDCIDILLKILKNKNNDYINNQVIKTLNLCITLCGNIGTHKYMYFLLNKERIYTKMNNSINKIDDEEVRSYLIAVYKTYLKNFFNNY